MCICIHAESECFPNTGFESIIVKTPSRAKQLRLPHSPAPLDALTQRTESVNAPLHGLLPACHADSCPFKHGENVPPARTPLTSRSDRRRCGVMNDELVCETQPDSLARPGPAQPGSLQGSAHLSLPVCTRLLAAVSLIPSLTAQLSLFLKLFLSPVCGTLYVHQ